MLKTNFKDSDSWFSNVKDPRKRHLITYELSTLLRCVLLTFIFKLESNRSFYYTFSGDIVLMNFRIFVNDPEIKRIPHYDTVKNVMHRLNPIELELQGVKITRELLRKKSFDKYRFLDGYILLAIDGTNQLSFKYQHCPKCLHTDHKDKKGKVTSTTYHHNLLIAKIIFSNGITLPVATEFIENDPKKNYNKQNCEIKAAYKLLDRVKKYFPQLKICLLADSLYVNKKIIKRCQKNKWLYIINFKEGSAKALFRDYQYRQKIQKNFIKITGDTRKRQIIQKYGWKNDLDFTSGKVNVLELNETKNNTTKCFMFITNIFVDEKNITTIVNEGGRLRWKIENEVINEEKNGGYNLEHLYCEDLYAIKNYVFLLQIAHTLNQLFEKGIISVEERRLLGGRIYLTKKIVGDFIYISIRDCEIKKINFWFDSS